MEIKEITKRLKIITVMLDREYKEDPKKTTRAIYRAVAELHDDIISCGVITWKTQGGKDNAYA